MAETMKGLVRSARCGEFTVANVGQEVTVMGWVQKQRNKGGIIFVDLRDRSGLLQVIFEEADCGNENFAKAESLRSEFVVAVVGKVEKREGNANANMKTGDKVVLTMTKALLANKQLDEKNYLCEVLRYEPKGECIYLVLENDLLSAISLDAVYECKIAEGEEERVCTGRIKERFYNEYGILQKTAYPEGHKGRVPNN